ncbi:META domain-containing protein [Palleronia sediminis]|uniref:META domain-containing protein n=1 Tax=Palleronia sediminis TaxID=2547833 RepID=A0A4R5ZT58_9RHOB|nr:META domain-containing protein [Palleronia sediminis]
MQKSLATQETRLLDLLARVTRYSIAENGTLTVETPDGETVVARR